MADNSNTTSTLNDVFLRLIEDAARSSGSTNKFALAVGIHQSALSRWLSRTSSPTMAAAQPVLDYLGLEARFVRPSADNNAPPVDAASAASIAEKDRIIIDLQIRLARAEGEVAAMDRQLDRMTAPPTPIALSSDKKP